MTTTETLHTARLKNNCPECFANNGLEFSFTQEQTIKKLFTTSSKKISEKLYCHTCNNTIYPVNWSEDIERVYNYHKKQVHQKKSGMRFTALGYLFIAGSIILLGLSVLLAIKNL